MNKEFSFTKNHTEIIKGAAILLMLFHHLFGFPEWYGEGISYIGIPLRANTLEYVIGQFGHICVGIFAFLTGYGMFFSYRSGSIIKKSFKKGISFLVCYWLILFLVAIPVNLWLGKTDLTLKYILNNLFAYDNTLVSFAWYVRFYIEMLLTLPLFYLVLKKFPRLSIPIFILLPVLAGKCLGMIASENIHICKIVYYSMEYFLWIPCVLAGMLIARFCVFEKLGKLFSKLGNFEITSCILLMLALVYLRAYKTETAGILFNRDVIYAPVFVFLTVKVIDRLPEIFRSFLKLMGKHSMNIWFLHSVFFFRTAELMKYIYFPKISVLIIAWVILICLPISLVLIKFSDFMFSGKKRTEKNVLINK